MTNRVFIYVIMTPQNTLPQCYYSPPFPNPPKRNKSALTADVVWPLRALGPIPAVVFEKSIHSSVAEKNSHSSSLDSPFKPVTPPNMYKTDPTVVIVWNALALGLAPDVVTVIHCFDKTSNLNKVLEMYFVSAPPNTHTDPSTPVTIVQPIRGLGLPMAHGFMSGHLCQGLGLVAEMTPTPFRSRPTRGTQKIALTNTVLRSMSFMLVLVTCSSAQYGITMIDIRSRSLRTSVC